MVESQPIIFIVDDDPSIRSFLNRLIGSLGYRAKVFASGEELLGGPRPDCPACIILDVQMPGLSGLDLQRELAGIEPQLPIIFVTGHGDIPMSVQAMKAGAVGFFTKPFRNQDLLDAIHEGIARDRESLRLKRERDELMGRYNALTIREKEVFALVITGLLNKQIAGQLGTSERTVKAHRAQVMQKMRAESLADLVRMSDRLGIAPLAPGGGGPPTRYDHVASWRHARIPLLFLHRDDRD
jgi:FixJ family two-component response regulator